MLTNKFNYQPINRETIDGKRHYQTPDGSAVVSVTTVLSATKPARDKAMLENWRRRVGADEAERITNEAADRGSAMHEYLEEYCLTDQIIKKSRAQLTPREHVLGSQGFKMANIVISDGLKDLNECWGVEAPVYYSGLYAGATDCVGVYEHSESIVDFKQSNKPKKREWVEDYFMQLAAYAEAHNNMFGTNIKKGVVLMCTKDLKFQKFVLEGNEYNVYMNKWFDRVAKYYDEN